MRNPLLLLVFWLAAYAQGQSQVDLPVSKRQFLGSRQRRPPPGRGLPAPLTTGNATFTQFIDHSDPQIGTFQQFYYWDITYWRGPGSPVVVFTPGETAVDGYQGYLSNRTITGAIAQRIGAATIVLEHRYWGWSSPYQNLTTANLRYLTLNNSIQDLVAFARTVTLPFTLNGNILSTSSAVPWILVGGSYSGALAAWTASVASGTYWAYLASSAVVEAIDDFWQYYVPVQEGMPQNCSIDISRAIDHVDDVLQSGTPQQVSDLKSQFGLTGIQHNDDFMNVLSWAPSTWQDTDFDNSAEFFQFCDYIENATSITDVTQLPDTNGVGTTLALAGYAAWMQQYLGSDPCGTSDLSCFNTYDPNNPTYTDLTVATGDRQWAWLTCNEPFGWWQDGAPVGTPALVSRLITASYYSQQCALWFPPGPQGPSYGLARGKTEDQLNAWTGGWFSNTTRLIFTNGEWDPWRSATVSSDGRPGGRLQSTAQVPVNVIPGGRHCSDLLTSNGDANAGCRDVQNSEVAQIAQWVLQFPKKGLNVS